jgi:hypothetical protein
MVTDRLRSLSYNLGNAVAWSTNQPNVTAAYAIAAYQARLIGSGTVSLPANDDKLIGNIKHADEVVAKFIEIQSLLERLDRKLGYGVHTYADGSCAVLSFNTGEVDKYMHFDDVPQNIREKLAMFKVIETGEPYSHLGIKLVEHGVFYIVDGETQTEQ